MRSDADHPRLQVCVSYDATISREVVNLQHMDLGPQMAVHLSAILSGNNIVTSLGLPNNAFGDAGVAALAKAMASMPNLGGVDLGTNDITEEGALALADAIRSCKSPKWRGLCLDKNRIGDTGALAIIAAVEENWKQGKPDVMDSLYIKWNGLSDETVESMRATWAVIKAGKSSAEQCLAVEIQ